MFHILIDPKQEFGSGLLRDANANPVVFETQEAASDWLATTAFRDTAIIVNVDEPINLHNPGDVPQVGASGNPTVPGMQVHPASIDYPGKVSGPPTTVRVVNLAVPEQVREAEKADAEGKAKLTGGPAASGDVVTEKTDEQVKREDEQRVKQATGQDVHHGETAAEQKVREDREAKETPAERKARLENESPSERLAREEREAAAAGKNVDQSATRAAEKAKADQVKADQDKDKNK